MTVYVIIVTEKKMVFKNKTQKNVCGMIYLLSYIWFFLPMFIYQSLYVCEKSDLKTTETIITRIYKVLIWADNILDQS